MDYRKEIAERINSFLAKKNELPSWKREQETDKLLSDIAAILSNSEEDEHEEETTCEEFIKYYM